VQPRIRNKISSTGIGTPINHKNTQPAFPASPALSHIIFIHGNLDGAPRFNNGARARKTPQHNTQRRLVAPEPAQQRSFYLLIGAKAEACETAIANAL
jgi:hypothetical protein